MKWTIEFYNVFIYFLYEYDIFGIPAHTNV